MGKPTLIVETKTGPPNEPTEFEWLLMMHSLDPCPPVPPSVLWQFFVVGIVAILTGDNR